MGQWPRSLSGRDDDDGAQISFGDDHRWPGVARERLLSRFSFFSSLFSPLSPPVRWERKPDRGSLRPLSDRPAPLRHRECKREEETEYEGWTERTGVNRLNFTNPVDMCYAQWETFSGPVRSVAIFVRCAPRVMGKPGEPDIGHERNWTSFDKGSSRRVENITTHEPPCM